MSEPCLFVFLTLRRNFELELFILERMIVIGELINAVVKHTRAKWTFERISKLSRELTGLLPSLVK